MPDVLHTIELLGFASGQNGGQEHRGASGYMLSASRVLIQRGPAPKAFAWSEGDFWRKGHLGWALTSK